MIQGDILPISSRQIGARPLQHRSMAITPQKHMPTGHIISDYWGVGGGYSSYLLIINHGLTEDIPCGKKPH